MRTLKENELKTFEQLVSLSQPALKKVMSKFLRSKYHKVTETKDYILAKGDIPIALVAHMDTVFDKPVENMFYDARKNVIWSPEGLGADDRAGVFAIIQIIRSGLRPHIILTTDEEKGCLGAAELCEIKNPFKKLQYIIELDRRGANDCVFYDCESPEFVEYIESFGFVENWGSFSDICEICPAWGVAGVNLSVGYKDEHSYSELLYVSHLLATIDKVKKMLQEKDIPFFKYVESPYAYSWSKLSKKWQAPYEDEDDYDTEFYKKFYGTGWNSTMDGDVTLPVGSVKCKGCGHIFLEEEVFPVKLLSGGTGYYCPDCIVDKVSWCDRCNEAFEIGDGDTVTNVCYDCRGNEEVANG